MKQLLISVGRRHDALLAGVIDEFISRVDREVETTWQFVRPSGSDEITARRVESASVLSLIRDADFVVLLDERGAQMSSIAFAASYDSWLTANQRIVFVIGGAYGVNDALRQRADIVWSLSLLVFPHQLVRAILAEQLYRARMITKNHPYHHS